MQRKRPRLGWAGDKDSLLGGSQPTCEQLLRVYEDAIQHLQQAAACLSGGGVGGAPSEEFFQHFADFGFALNKLLVSEHEALPKQCLRFLQASYEQNYIAAHSKPSKDVQPPSSDPASPRRARSVSASPRPRVSLCDIARAPSVAEQAEKMPTPQRETVQHQEGERRSQAIEETIHHVSGASTGFSFDDIAGHDEAKGLLREAVVLPLVYPQLFSHGRQPWRCILLHGPPGTGKTKLAQAVAHEVRGMFYSVGSADLVSSWVGESEKLIRELFMHARRQQGCSVIFIDELDSLCRRRSEREEEHTRRIKTELLRQMDGVDSAQQQGQVFVLGATNCPWELDTAFLRRFQKRVYLPLPDLPARIALLALKVKEAKECVELSADDLAQLAARLESFSGSDIAAVFADALFEPVREVMRATLWARSGEAGWVPASAAGPSTVAATLQELPPAEVHARPVQLADFLAVLPRNTPTADAGEVARHNEFARV